MVVLSLCSRGVVALCCFVLLWCECDVVASVALLQCRVVGLLWVR